jgi:hypothetical protein
VSSVEGDITNLARALDIEVELRKNNGHLGDRSYIVFQGIFTDADPGNLLTLDDRMNVFVKQFSKLLVGTAQKKKIWFGDRKLPLTSEKDILAALTLQSNNTYDKDGVPWKTVRWKEELTPKT